MMRRHLVRFADRISVGGPADTDFCTGWVSSGKADSTASRQ